MRVFLSVGMIGLMVSFPQTQQAGADGLQEAARSLQEGRLIDAEKGFEAVTHEHPENVAAEMYLGHTLFREGKYPGAVASYEKVQALEKSGLKLSLTQQRILGDQLAMAYGLSGRSADAKALLEKSIKKDPNYPLNYYNLACAAADENDKPAVLKNLTLAFQHRHQVLVGEQMPNPISDPSFRKYAEDSDFKALVSHFED